MRILKYVVYVCIIGLCNGVTYYEYYENGGITSGLTAEGDKFQLNGKDIQLFSGSFHYFRIHPEYWRTTMKKMRAAGLNTISTYMPWNLHNPKPGEFNFNTDPTDGMSVFLDVRKFIQMAYEEDLFVILRPGPYICAEWDFGGLPSWLLSVPGLGFRSSDERFTNHTKEYLEAVASQVNDLLFQNGGSIIAVQVENEYGAFGYSDDYRDKDYLRLIRNVLDENGFQDALYFTSDSPLGTQDWGAIPRDGVLMMANFNKNADGQLAELKALQPNRPLMVAEFWTGWFDHWTEDHHTVDVEEFESVLRDILSWNSSVNLYMFIGGTNFGFMAGANRAESYPYYQPTVTSYDYDSPLTESGDYTDKYETVVELIEEYSTLSGIVTNPARPEASIKTAYGSFDVAYTLSLDIMSSYLPSFQDTDLQSMEYYGQSQGYIYYTTFVENSYIGNHSLVIRGHIRDLAQVMVDGNIITTSVIDKDDIDNFGSWIQRDSSIDFVSAKDSFRITILVENLGRVNYGKPHYFMQKKGIWEGECLIDLKHLQNWESTPIELEESFINQMTGNLSIWSSYTGSVSIPALYLINVNISTPSDTFLDMTSWGKGVVFVNGFNLGRYWTVGPTHTLYVPAPFLQTGINEFVVFEQYFASNSLVFIDTPLL